MHFKSLIISITATLASTGVSNATFAAEADPILHRTTGAVFTATNDPNGNEVVFFARTESGLLRKVKTIPTGGAGSGGQLDPLGSQGSMRLTANAKWLVVVNAGSDEISVFKNWKKGPALVQKVRSGGKMPVSLAIHDNLVYVLNAGVSPNIVGFRLSEYGKLSRIHGSARTFEGVAANALAQIGFDAQGTELTITDKADNTLITYAIDNCGLPSTDAVTSVAEGKVPFGFIHDSKGHLLVVNAGSGTVASYSVKSGERAVAIGSSGASGQMAACWIDRTDQGFVYTTNPGSSTLSTFFSDPHTGAVSLVNGASASARSPLDLAIVANRFLYAVDPMAGGIDIFAIGQDGSLNSVGVSDASLAIFAQGIAAY